MEEGRKRAIAFGHLSVLANDKTNPVGRTTTFCEPRQRLAASEKVAR